MKIKKLVIKNYKKYRDISIELNSGVNIFIGDNNSGKSTILEAISMVLTGKINGIPITNKLNLDWFNYEVREEFKNSIINESYIDPPSILIEAYFESESLSDNDIKLNSYRGSNNSLSEDSIGVKIDIKLNSDYSSTYKELLENKKIEDIPIELYKIDFKNFAGTPDYYVTTTLKKIAIIDTTKKDYGTILNRFISNSISNFLSENEKTNLRLAYRANRKDFTNNEAVRNLNDKISSDYSFNNKKINLNLKENEIDSWKNEMSISLDNIPIEYIGFGVQNLLKAEMFLRENLDVDILCVEEPENNLSFTNMSIFIDKLTKLDKQLFISTHSSFVANKLNLKNIHLISDNTIKQFKNLPKETYEYFLKLSGYNTLRLILAKSIILVEGPTDELIIQKAYLDKYNALPIYNGIDIMAVGGLAFKNYCDLAKISEKKIFITTDNDGNYTKVKNKFEEYSEYVEIFVEENNDLNTLEPSILNANRDNFNEFRAIIYKRNDIDLKDYNAILNFMLKNKTEWAMRVFETQEKIKYPKHINDLLEAL